MIWAQIRGEGTGGHPPPHTHTFQNGFALMIWMTMMIKNNDYYYYSCTTTTTSIITTTYTTVRTTISTTTPDLVLNLMKTGGCIMNTRDNLYYPDSFHF